MRNRKVKNFTSRTAGHSLPYVSTKFPVLKQVIEKVYNLVDTLLYYTQKWLHRQTDRQMKAILWSNHAVSGKNMSLTVQGLGDSCMFTKPCFILGFSSLIHRDSKSSSPLQLDKTINSRPGLQKPPVCFLYAIFSFVCQLELRVAVEASRPYRTKKALDRWSPGP